MSIADGSKLYKNPNGTCKQINCSRWDEMVGAIEFHVNLASKANSATDFRFLNQLAPKRVGVKEVDPDNTHKRAIEKAFDEGPRGLTPLCKHVTDVVNEVTANQGWLRENNLTVCVVIVCDGQASDGNLAQAMKPLAHLPVHVVVRLCTSDESVVDYWDGIDSQLELALDILDDPIGEAEQIITVNPWLNSAIPIHRLREFGVKVQEFDRIDEELLSPGQMKRVLSYLFNCPIRDIPEPQAVWPDFKAFVEDKLKALDLQYNPATKKMEPWINMKQLTAKYAPPGAGGCCSVA